MEFRFPSLLAIYHVQRSNLSVSVFSSFVFVLYLCDQSTAVFFLAHEKWGIMMSYTSINEYGWLWYFLSIPVYLVLWDFIFYVMHALIHIEPIYSFSHANHHAFRPPVAWSGVAIDPFEFLCIGLIPNLLPLFIFPFHLYTMFALSLLLLAWSTFLHSASSWEGNWLFLGPHCHNIHHEYGSKNGNFSALLKVWDRVFGTLIPDQLHTPYWIQAEAEQRARASKLDSEQQYHILTCDD